MGIMWGKAGSFFFLAQCVEIQEHGWNFQENG
jgi:hypothetical protein